MMRGQAWRVLLAALVGAFILAGCTEATPDQLPTSSSPTTQPSASSATPTVSTTPSEAAAALAAYEAYWAAQVASQADPTRRQDPNLARYATGDALAGAQSTLLLFRQNGVAMQGEPVLSPSLTGASIGSTEVEIVDCVDSTKWKPIYVATGKSALAPGQQLRVQVVSRVELADGGWVVTSSVTQRDRSC
jgi:hypothetical protein